MRNVWDSQWIVWLSVQIRMMSFTGNIVVYSSYEFLTRYKIYIDFLSSIDIYRTLFLFFYINFNLNFSLSRFLETGRYHKIASTLTIAPSMDISVSSNFENRNNIYESKIVRRASIDYDMKADGVL